MKPNHRFTQIFFLLISTTALSDLQWPLKEKTYLTGTFGEFRKNHIHAGVDISTHGKIGLPIYAGDSGLLYRVKTQYLGFGKAIYIKLNNGNLLVYAHLDRFSPVIENIVKIAQQKEQKYEIDIHPKEKIVINKGDLIGYTGDTGNVSPHLHIELRDPEERPINILKHGLNIQDTAPPVISGLAICDPSDTHCISNYSVKEIPPKINIDGKKGIAISLYDPSTGNKIGIYELSVILDEKPFFAVKFNTFSYDEFNDNFIMCNKDLFINHNAIYYHLFRAFNNKLPFYSLNSDGILDLTPGKHSVKIDAIDNSGNRSILKFNINYKPVKQAEKQKLEKTQCFSKDKLCRVAIEKDDLYYPFEINIETISNKKFGELIPMSNIYIIEPGEAVFKKATVSINVPRCSSGHIYKYENDKWKFMDKDTMTDFTRFALFKDITPPNINTLSTHPIFKAKIDDKGSGLDYDKISLEIDGQKVIAEYSVKRKELFYKIPEGKHKVTCTAIDKAGNINRKEVSI